MASYPHAQATSFHLVLEKFKNSLSSEERTQFSATSVQDLYLEIEKIQQRQKSERRLQGMTRLQSFLEGMKEYDKVISVFLNSDQILAFVWVFYRLPDPYHTDTFLRAQ